MKKIFEKIAKIWFFDQLVDETFRVAKNLRKLENRLKLWMNAQLQMRILAQKTFLPQKTRAERFAGFDEISQLFIAGNENSAAGFQKPRKTLSPTKNVKLKKPQLQIG